MAEVTGMAIVTINVIIKNVIATRCIEAITNVVTSTENMISVSVLEVRIVRQLAQVITLLR